MNQSAHLIKLSKQNDLKLIQEISFVASRGGHHCPTSDLTPGTSAKS